MTTGVIDHVQVENSANNGIEVATTTATINVTISDSLSTHGANNGIICPTGGSALINIMVRNSTIANNAADGLYAGNTCTIRVTRSTITGNNFGWLLNGFGAVSSYGDNNIDGNTSGDNTEPPNPLVYH